MKTKMRWVTIEGLDSNLLNVIKELVVKHEFSDRRGSGFVVDKSRENAISGSYVEVQKRTDIVVSPYGEKIKYRRRIYKDVKFILKGSPYQLCIKGNPKCYFSFISRISEYTSYGIALVEPTVDPLVWYDGFSKSAPGIKIVSVCVSDIPLSVQANMNCQIFGKPEIRKELDAFLIKKKYNIRSLKFEGENYICELKNNGVVSVEGEFREDIFKALHGALLSVDQNLSKQDRG